jgi:hypothetical protein
MPDAEDPQPPSRVEDEREVQVPTQISDDEYHAHADQYMEAINEKAEAMQEAREDVEVEFSVCQTLPLPQLSHPLTTLAILGRRPLHLRPQRRHLHHQQTATEQTDLALQPDVRPEAVRLGA